MTYNIKSIENCIEKRNKYENNVISVTGTCGKTTTCKMIYDILKNIYTIDKTHENRNSFVGIPNSINYDFNLKSNLWLVEIGIGGLDQMNSLTFLVKPNIRIITNVLVSHTHKNFTPKQYQTEKLKFIKNLPPNTVVIINNDDKLISSQKFNDDIVVIRCGSKSSDDVQLVSYAICDDNISSVINIKIKDKTEISNINFKLNGIGYHNAFNVCLAIGCAIYLNVPIDTIQKSINNFDFYSNRGKIILKPNYILYDYSYNCVYNACYKNLETFKKIKNKNKLIIFGFNIITPTIVRYLISYSKIITNNIIIFLPELKIQPIDEIITNSFQIITNSHQIKKINQLNETTTSEKIELIKESNELINESNHLINEKLQNIIIISKYNDIINHIKPLIKPKEQLSIFIQGSAEANLFNIVDIIKNSKF